MWPRSATRPPSNPDSEGRLNPFPPATAKQKVVLIVPVSEVELFAAQPEKCRSETLGKKLP